MFWNLWKKKFWLCNFYLLRYGRFSHESRTKMSQSKRTTHHRNLMISEIIHYFLLYIYYRPPCISLCDRGWSHRLNRCIDRLMLLSIIDALMTGEQLILTNWTKIDKKDVCIYIRLYVASETILIVVSESYKQFNFNKNMFFVNFHWIRQNQLFAGQQH